MDKYIVICAYLYMCACICVYTCILHICCLYSSKSCLFLSVMFGFRHPSLGKRQRSWAHGLAARRLGSHALGRQTGPATPAPVLPGLRAASQADSGSVLRALGQGLPARPAEARRAGEPPQKGLRGETEARGI